MLAARRHADVNRAFIWQGNNNKASTVSKGYNIHATQQLELAKLILKKITILTASRTVFKL
jgi:hypothetical protein